MNKMISSNLMSRRENHVLIIKTLNVVGFKFLYHFLPLSIKFLYFHI